MIMQVDLFPMVFVCSYLSSPLQFILLGRRKEGRQRAIFASLFDCMWNVEWKWACLFFIFFLYELWCFSDGPYWKKKLKTGNSNFVRHFIRNQTDLKLSDFLSHYCHLMAAPLEILFLCICFASKKKHFSIETYFKWMLPSHLNFMINNIKKTLLWVFASYFEELISSAFYGILLNECW